MEEGIVGSTVKFVTCPECKAKPGAECVTKAGKPFRRSGPGYDDEQRLFHWKRMEAFWRFRRGRKPS